MHTKVEITEEDDYTRLVLSEEIEDAVQGLHVSYHEVPIQAVANRMELFGFESIEQTLEYIGLEVSKPEVADSLYQSLHRDYGAVVQAEFAQSLMPTPLVDARTRQTFMEPMAIGSNRRDDLRETRNLSLSRMGMKSVIHSEPMLRVMDSTRPTERTRPAAAEALGAEESVIEQAVTLTQGRLDELNFWRMETVSSFVPALREKFVEMIQKEANS